MFNKPWIFFVPVLIGIFALILLKQNSSNPQQLPTKEITTIVRSLSIVQMNVKPIAIGYGTVQPVSVWEAVAQVEGIVIKKHPELGKGAIIEKDSILLQIDPTDYELSIAQIEADILANQAQIEELNIKQDNTQASLSIEKKSLELTKLELNRLQNLSKKGSVSFSDVETQERTMLGQQQSVQTQQNSLKLIPSQRALLEAQLQQKQSQLRSAQRNLENTRISMPFTGRISVDNVELAQYVRIGNTLTAADRLDKAEIEVQIPIRYFRGLLKTRDNNIGVNLLDISSQTLKKSLGIQAQVILLEGGLNITWDAQFNRLSDTLDPKTRTIGVIVDVNNPYDNVKPGSRPPLMKGFFVEVHLKGAARPNSLVVPRSALHNNQIYLINKQNRLEILPVKVELYQPEFAIISNIEAHKESNLALKEGDNIVISDLTPAIQGMLLSPQPDSEMTKRLKSLINFNKAGLNKIEQKKTERKNSEFSHRGVHQ